MINILKVIKNRNFAIIFNRCFSTKNNYDLCIVGGGPIGFGLASLIGVDPHLQSKRVLVLETQKQKQYSRKTEFSNRTVALNLQTRDILEKCGAWEIICNDRYHCVRKMFVWEQTSQSSITFHQDNASSELAYIVETDLLQHAITSTLRDRPNVSVKYGAHVTNIDFKRNEAKLLLSDGSEASASVVVGADGYKSQVRTMAGIHSAVVLGDGDRQKAVVGVVKFSSESGDRCDGSGSDNGGVSSSDSSSDSGTDKGGDSPIVGVAWQRFTRHGPIAYLPLDERHCNVIWSTTSERADQLMALDDDAFVTELNREMFTEQYRHATLRQLDAVMRALPLAQGAVTTARWQPPPEATGIVAGSRATFPLGCSHATNYVARRVVLVGDAAHRILPLAGQGVNLGFGDVDCLVRQWRDGYQLGEAIDDYRRLQQYETERQRHVLPVLATVQGLHKLYSSDLMPLVMGRAIGLRFIDSMKPLKDFFLRGATDGKLAVSRCCPKKTDRCSYVRLI